jgi:hypothetical protein
MNHRQWMVVCALVVGSSTVGCLLPDYKTPGGFSSSYHRHLMQARPRLIADGSVVNGREGASSASRKTGVFFPPTVSVPMPKDTGPVVAEIPMSSRERRPTADGF